MFKPDAKPYIDLSAGDWTFKDGLLYARLPNGDRWCSVWKNGAGDHETVTWEVSGTQESPTVTPSIHASPGDGPPREWHGYLTNGKWREA